MYDGGSIAVISGGSGWPVTGMRVLSGGQVRSFFPALFFLFPLGGMVGWGVVWELQIPLFAKLVMCGCLLGVGETREPMLVEGVFREKRGRR